MEIELIGYVEIAIDLLISYSYIASSQLIWENRDMILGRLPQKLALQYYKVMNRFNSNDAFDIFEHLYNAKNVLIYTPVSADDFSVAKEYFEPLGSAFPNALISLLLHEDQVLPNAISIPHKLITITKKHLTSLGFPKKDFMRTLKKKRFDAVIDLTPEFDFIGTFVSRSSGAKLCICLSNPDREPFYNFLIRTAPDLPLERRYETLIHYLKACVNTVVNEKPE